MFPQNRPKPKPKTNFHGRLFFLISNAVFPILRRRWENAFSPHAKGETAAQKRETASVNGFIALK